MRHFLVILVVVFQSFHSLGQTLILNEVSNGAFGNKEYVEFVVADTAAFYDCNASTPPGIDIRGWIFDDNSGYHGSGGIAPGAMRFSNDPLWSSVPLGTIILLYNDADPGLLIPADDLTLADNNCRLVVPVSNTQLIEKNVTTPGGAACSYPSTGWVSGGDWSFTFLANSGDCARVVDLSGCEVFSVCWAACNSNNLIYFASGGSGSQNVWYFNDGNPYQQSNWSEGDVNSGIAETPGLPNNTVNAQYIAQFNNGCVPIPPISVTALSTDSDCSGCTGTATAAPLGSLPGYTFQWLDSLFNPIGQTSITATALCVGMYQVIATSSVGCSDTASVSVNASGTGTTTILEVQACIGNMYTYPDGVVHTIQSDTSHTSVFNLGVGCDSTIFTNVTAITGFTSNESVTACRGNTLMLPDGNTLIADADTVIAFSLSSISGCDSMVNYALTIIESFNLIESATICNGDTYTFPDGITQTITADTQYASTFLGVDGCDSIINTLLTVSPVGFTRETVELCSGREYVFPDGTVVSDIQSDTVYTSTLFTVDGCDSLVATTITVNQQGLDSEFNFFPSNPSQEDNEVQFYTNAPGNLLWTVADTAGNLIYSTTDSSLSYDFPVDTIYSHVVCLQVEQDGCEGTFCDTILLLAKPTIYIPNSFTPENSAGINDIWLPIIGGGVPYRYELEVFNRWGEKLLETTDPYQGWDGIHQGKLVQRGVYAYRLFFSIEPYAYIYQYAGHITVMR